MTYIRVLPEDLTTAAKSAEDYLTSLRQKMLEANQEVEKLDQSWQGVDEVQFREEWAQLTGKESAYYQMAEALESYANYLNYVREKYESAGKRADLRAKLLP